MCRPRRPWEWVSERLPVAQAGPRASKAEAHSGNVFVAAKIDAFSAALAEDSFSFVAGQVGWIHLDANAFNTEKLIIHQLSIGKHLLLPDALDFGMKLPGQVTGVFKRNNPHPFAARKVDERGRHLSPIAELQGSTAETTAGYHADGIGGTAVNFNERDQALAIGAQRIGNAESLKPEHRHAHTQNLAGAHVTMRDLGLLEQRVKRLDHSLPD